MGDRFKTAEFAPGQLNVYESQDGKTLLVTPEPGFVMMPRQLGGRKANVTEVFYAKRCKCGTHSNAKVAVLDNGYMMVECTRNGFAWCKRPADIEKFKRGVMGIEDK